MSGKRAGGIRTQEFRFDRDATAPASARHALAELIDDPRRRDDAVLLVSELVSNAVRHGRGDSVTVAFRTAEPRLRVEVGHEGDFAKIGHAVDGGRGLGIVDAVADEWGVVAGDGNVIVWFEL